MIHVWKRWQGCRQTPDSEKRLSVIISADENASSLNGTCLFEKLYDILLTLLGG